MADHLRPVRTVIRRLLVRDAEPSPGYEACTWDQLRAVYEEQAARGVPEAIVGLERMDQGRWPSDGTRRKQGA